MNALNKFLVLIALFVFSVQSVNAQVEIDYEFVDNFYSVENVLGGPYQMCINDTNLRNNFGYLLDTSYEIFVDSVSVHEGLMQDTNPCFLVPGSYNFGFGYGVDLEVSSLTLATYNDRISLDLDPFYTPPIPTTTPLEIERDSVMIFFMLYTLFLMTISFFAYIFKPFIYVRK